jgi:hypothetical protein
MKVIRYLVLCLVQLIFGCRSANVHEFRSPEHTGIPPIDSIRPSQHPTIRRFTTVTFSGIIDSIILSDSISYSLRMRIVTSDRQNEESPAAGQIIDIIPEFVMDEHASVDRHASRNRDLARLRASHRGDTVRGTMLYDKHSQWKLIGIGGQ